MKWRHAHNAADAPKPAMKTKSFIYLCREMKRNNKHSGAGERVDQPHICSSDTDSIRHSQRSKMRREHRIAMKRRLKQRICWRRRIVQRFDLSSRWFRWLCFAFSFEWRSCIAGALIIVSSFLLFRCARGPPITIRVRIYICLWTMTGSRSQCVVALLGMLIRVTALRGSHGTECIVFAMTRQRWRCDDPWSAKHTN